MSDIKVWLEATRPKTLPAAIAPVLLGSALAFHVDAFHFWAALICVLFALLVQIGTNFANDYLDGVKGTDTDARLGPRRAVASGLVSAGQMKWAALAVLLVAFCLGLSLIAFGGWWLLLVGVASVACAWLYTGGPYPLAYNGLGDVFVVLFFGLIAVSCTFYVQAGMITVDSLLLGLACGLVVNNILVVNNYRDRDEDTLANKRTLVVLLGRRWALIQYGLSAGIAGFVLLWLVFQGYPPVVLLGLFPVFLSFMLLSKLKAASTVADYLAGLKGSALVVVLYGALVSFGLLF